MKSELSREEIASLPELDVAITIIMQTDEYLLQYRTPESENGAVGLVGAFGGVIEEQDNNSGLNTAVRELKEEVGLEISPKYFDRKGMVYVVSDRDSQPVFIKAEVFGILLQHGFPVNALQGELRRMRLEELRIAKAKHQLTPATQAAMERYYGV